MTQQASIRFNPSTGEIEVSGSPEFVKEHLYLIDSQIKSHKETVNRKEQNSLVVHTNIPSGTSKRIPTNQPFKGYIKSLPPSTRQGDFLLAAAHYISMSSADACFGTREASTLLKTAGVEVTNPSQYVKNSVNSGRIEIADKRRFRLTEKGYQHLDRVFSR